MDRIKINEHDVLELCRCYKCDCSTYPICTWLGEPCKLCFDIETFSHFDADQGKPGLFLNGLEHQHARLRHHQLTIVNRRPLVKTRIQEIKTDGNGDCLYECIALALNRYISSTVSLQKIAIADLRFLVSQLQTNETYEAYKTLASTGEYDCLAKVRNIRGFKNVIQDCGAVVGPENCLWGDENTLGIFSNAFHLRFVVFDEHGKLLQVVGQQEYGHTILLRLNRVRAGEEHFTLLQFNGETIIKQHEWLWLKKSLGLKI
jgi:hypothetical protein